MVLTCNKFIRPSYLNIPVPELCKLKAINFSVRYFDDSFFYDFGIQCPKGIHNAVSKRKAEFFAGRYCANLALNELGLFNMEVPVGMHRNPIWPKGISGSISHTEGKAVSVVSYKRHIRYLGVDIEKRMQEVDIGDIKRTVINPFEERLLVNCQLTFSDAFVLVFSAKESLFKALYPYVKDYFDFTSVSINSICNISTSFTLLLNEDLAVNLTRGMMISGIFRFDEKFVTTLIANNGIHN